MRNQAFFRIFTSNKKVMDKELLLEKVKKGNYEKDQLVKWIMSLPSVYTNRKPTTHKKGDVLMHPIFQHPYVLLERKGNIWICGIITSESKCPEILEPCRSRFFHEHYLTKTIFTASELPGSFINNYDNPRHLTKVLQKLKEIFK